MTLILFDVDGTLIYSERRDSRCFAQTYTDLYGKPFPSIDWRQYPHVSDTTIFAKVIQDHFNRAVQAEEVAAFKQLYGERLRHLRTQNPEHYREVPGAAQAVIQLLEHPAYLVAVATGGWKESAEIKMQHVGIPSDHFWVSGADDKYTREEILNEATAAVKNVYPQVQRVVYVGDAVWDVHTTRNLDMDFLGIRHTHDHEILLNLGATQVISNFLDFELFIRAIEAAAPPK
ncbi:HAD family hydrolase [Haliscomenobacter hydrossis]|uniref:phosphoglycolate phosphatase n=1 Tax=Haliscomenobacter hydrossis (strain ATCC 27775 / DSM 1100 / LMG 10767 / O) TaxID=760192 RepID=F4L3Q8_HALH1|nr:HAD hydrolase-like protein [Haliscomenobacter hydrossis]AEE48662.1 Haloacid dehalogenase domain protein hydrolase [Haliscomenobacter hydrossis DSM 1100]